MELENESNIAVAEFRKPLIIERTDILIIVTDYSEVWTVKGSGNLKQRGFACPAGSHNGYDFIFFNLEADI